MKDLYELCHQLQPTLEKMEIDRRDYKKKQAIFLPISLLVAATGPIYFFTAGGGFLSIIAIIIGIASSFALYHFTAGHLGSAYKRSYKDLVITKLVNLIDSGLSYHAESGISSSTFSESELYTTVVDRYSTEDLIQGDYGNTSLRLAEVHAEDRRQSRDSKGNSKTTYVTIFQGLFLIADFHKHFQGRTFVFPDKAEKMFGFLGRKLQKFSGRSGTQLVQLEDTEFEEAFVVHTTDQVEARYVLSTSMMRRILDMRNRFGKDVRMAFKDSSVWLAVPYSSSYLEPTTSVPATNEIQIQKMLEEIKLFLDTIDELNLNTRIWSKE